MPAAGSLKRAARVKHAARGRVRGARHLAGQRLEVREIERALELDQQPLGGLLADARHEAQRVEVGLGDDGLQRVGLVDRQDGQRQRGADPVGAEQGLERDALGPGGEAVERLAVLADVVVDVSSYATQPVVDALSMVRVGGRVVLAGVKGFKSVDNFVSDLIVMKEINLRGAIGVTSSGYRSAIRLLEAGAVPFDQMHTHDFDLAEAELAIRTLAREIEGEESIHSCLIPPN